MIVLDTNVLVRVITKDDIDQARQAVALLQGPGPFWISRVVLLETAWTLKSRYGYTRAQVSQALHVLVALEGAEVEDRDRVRRALALYTAGMDFGDALIAALAPEGATVATFDTGFVKKVEREGGEDLPPTRLVSDLVTKA